MKTFFRSRYLLIGVLAGLLLGGGWFAWAAIQSEIGLNIYDYNRDATLVFRRAIGANAAIRFGLNAQDIGLQTFTPVYVTGDGVIIAPCTGGTLSCNADRVQLAPMGVAHDASQTLYTPVVSGIRRGPGGATDDGPDGVLSFNWLSNGNIGVDAFGNYNVSYPQKSASTTNLIASPLDGVALTLPASNVSCTSTPAAGAQATCTLAAGAGTVRHVATTVTVCASDPVAATVMTINLRDGATGAGTVKWSALISLLAGESKCVPLSGLSITGSATTAMTLEFAAAGAGTTSESVTLTALNVQ